MPVNLLKSSIKMTMFDSNVMLILYFDKERIDSLRKEGATGERILNSMNQCFDLCRFPLRFVIIKDFQILEFTHV